MSSSQEYDVIVIGGGASGMMAAGRASLCGHKVLLIEKNKELGKKLSITGGGRCNILNAETDTKKLLSHYGDAAKFLHSPYAQHGMQDSWDFFATRGVPIVVEARKRAFPASQQATDVTECMRRYVNESHVELKLGTRVQNILTKDDRIEGIETNQGTYRAKHYILATGGAAHAQVGASDEGVSWLEVLGHTVHSPTPNIVPLKVMDEWVHALSGTTLSFMKITFGANRTKAEGKFSRTGKILFTHFGISGPLVLNAAHEVKKLLARGPVIAEIDMYPDTEIGTLRNRVMEVFSLHKNKSLKNILKEFVPAGMTDAVAAQLTDELQNRRVHSVERDERHGLVDRLKAMPFTVTGTMGLDWAVISDGGIPLDEIDTKTMRSKKCANLSLTGDVLHINRPSGGYSLQLCWTTGWVAGSQVTF